MLLRFLDTRPGRESECLRCLQGIATRMIQQERLDAVQICRYADGSGRIVWIEDRRTASRSGRVLDAEVAETCADTLVHGPVSQQFELVDGFYHYPLPRCYVWTLEVSPATGQEGGLSRPFWTERVRHRPSPRWPECPSIGRWEPLVSRSLWL